MDSRRYSLVDWVTTADSFGFKQTFILPSSVSSRYWRWMAKTRYSQYQVYLQEIEFELTAAWGWPFIGLLLLGIALYVAVFSAHNYKVKGLRGTVRGEKTDNKCHNSSLPATRQSLFRAFVVVRFLSLLLFGCGDTHRLLLAYTCVQEVVMAIHPQFWRELAALVLEGTQFTRLRVGELKIRASSRLGGAGGGIGDGESGNEPLVAPQPSVAVVAKDEAPQGR